VLRVFVAFSLPTVVPALPASAQQGPDTLPIPPGLQAAYAQGTRNRSGAPGENYWQIRPAYELVARLDPATATVHGSGTVSFINTSTIPLNEIFLRLDQNRFRAGNSRDVTTRGIDIRRLEVNGRPVDLTSSAIGGLNTTLVRVALRAPLSPGARLSIRSVWDYEVPLDERGLALRQGRLGMTVFQIAQWYPRLAMFDDLGGWDVTPHEGELEFYNPYARFHVTLQVPARWLVGATGTLKNAHAVLGPIALRRLEAAARSDTTLFVLEQDERGSGFLTQSSGNLTWEFEADSVSDFAWGASSEFAWTITSRNLPTGRLFVHTLMTPRHREALLAAGVRAANMIATLSRRIMPYAWTSHTLLDGPEGGMEYPALTMSHGDERLTHELAHQWFPMMVGSDETRFNFLDEGFATFFAGVADGAPLGMSAAQPALTAPLVSGTDLRTPRLAIGYGRGNGILHALAARIGEERLLAALSSYATHWRFKHPSPWDFMACVQATAGQDLRDFWQQWLFSSAAIPAR
jgi:hypothetical protein